MALTQIDWLSFNKEKRIAQIFSHKNGTEIVVAKIINNKMKMIQNNTR